METAKLVLDPAVVELGDTLVDRVNQAWLSSTGEALGYCQRLPLWDSLEVIAANSEGDADE